MTKDVDEDLIEATIRRVQGAGTPDGGDAAAPDEQAEDAIQATIRRVQAQAASPPSPHDFSGSESEDQPQGSYTPAEQSRIEDTIRRVRTQAASHAEDFAPVSTADVPSADEDPIEATIRRVQEQAARAAADHADESASAADDPIEATIRRVQAQAANSETIADADEDPIEATIRRVQMQTAQAPVLPEIADEPLVGFGSLSRPEDPVEEAIRAAEADSLAVGQNVAVEEPRGADDNARPEPTTWPGRDERLLGDTTTWEIAALRLEQGLQDARRDVREMAARIVALERVLADSDTGGTPVPLSVVPSSAVGLDDDWDDRPQMSNLQFGTPPRPPIYRDPSPQTATAAELVEEPAPAIEKPAARLRAIDAEGNLDDRIPRQYRITVEDKRRGVDLVPLHRAMQGLDNVKDMSLLSYSNGVAMVLIESVGPLDPEVLRLAVSRVMSRETLVEVHNEQTMVIKIQEE